MNVLAVAGDAGGARVLVPVLRQLATRPQVGLTCRPYKLATRIWLDAGFDARPLEKSPEDYTHALVATSVGVPIRELEVIEHARRVGARSVAVLDHWLNYRERFERDGTVVLPDAIAVMDDRARAEMVAAGFPPDRVVVTGSPALEAVRKPTDDERARATKRLGDRFGLSGSGRVLWASQPLTSGKTSGSLPFDSDRAFRGVYESLVRYAGREGREIDLLFKPHPREADRRATPTGDNEGVRVRQVPAGAGVREVVLGVDVVAGMHSMLLFESCILGVPVVSYQPDLSIRDPLVSNTMGWSIGVYDERYLDAAFDRAFSGQVDIPHLAGHCGAADRVVELLLGGS